MHSWRLLLMAAILVMASHAAWAADGELRGVITLNGEPLGGGRILFHWKEQFIGANIQQDGTYAINRVPAGEYKVTIEGKNVPAKHSSKEKTGLQVVIEAGDNTVDFDLRK